MAGAVTVAPRSHMTDDSPAPQTHEQKKTGDDAMDSSVRMPSAVMLLDVGCWMLDESVLFLECRRLGFMH